MPIKFSKEEQFLINALSKKPSEIQNLDDVAALLVKNIGNTDFSDRLYAQENSQWLPVNEEKGRLILERWAYKTPTAQEIESIATKIQIAQQLQKQGIELLPEEKISLLELKAISRFSLLLGKKDRFREEDIDNNRVKDLFKGTLEQIYNKSTNKEFKELYDNMVICEQLAAELRRDISEHATYQEGDILIRDTQKSAIIEDVAQAGTKLPSVQIFTYEEATPLYVSRTKYNLIEAAQQVSKGFETLSSIDKVTPEEMHKLSTVPGARLGKPKPSTSYETITKYTFSTTDILSSNIWRLPDAQDQNQTLIQSLLSEQDPKKLEELLIKNGAQKVSNSVAEEFVRTEDVQKSKTFNNIEDNLANTLETLAKTAGNERNFISQARPRIEAYLAVAGPENHKTTPNPTDIDNELTKLYSDRNKTGLKAEIIKFISSTLVTLGLKKSETKKTIQKIRGPFTDKLLTDRKSNVNAGQNKGHGA